VDFPSDFSSFASESKPSILYKEKNEKKFLENSSGWLNKNCAKLNPKILDFSKILIIKRSF